VRRTREICRAGLTRSRLNDLLVTSGEARRELGELVAVAEDLRDLQIRGCRALASALLCRLYQGTWVRALGCAVLRVSEWPAEESRLHKFAGLAPPGDRDDRDAHKPRIPRLACADAKRPVATWKRERRRAAADTGNS
jgi:hypothetical protein